MLGASVSRVATVHFGGVRCPRRLVLDEWTPAPRVVWALSALLVAVVGWASSAWGQDRGLAIMKEQEQANRGFQSEIALYRMVLVNASGDRSERVIEMRSLEGGEAGDKTLIVFKAPPDINGTGLLTHQNKAGDDDQWLYLPALKRVRRVAASSLASSFVGSEFTYEDLVPFELSKYTFRYLREDAVDGTPVWVVESVPRFKDSGYSRVELFVNKDTHQTFRAAYYDKRGELLKTGRFEDWTRVDGKWWRARSVAMENQQTRKSTTLAAQQIKLRAGLSSQDFTTRALER